MLCSCFLLLESDSESVLSIEADREMGKTSIVQHMAELLLCQVQSSPAWTSKPSLNTTPSQATWVIPMNWSWLDCHVRMFQEKIFLMPESYSWQPDLGFSAVLHQGKCCNSNEKLKKINKWINKLETWMVKIYSGYAITFLRKNKVPSRKKNH